MTRDEHMLQRCPHGVYLHALDGTKATCDSCVRGDVPTHRYDVLCQGCGVVHTGNDRAGASRAQYDHAHGRCFDRGHDVTLVKIPLGAVPLAIGQ